MKKPALGVLAAALVFISAHLYLGSQAIAVFSPTYDEPLHLTAGYVYWKTGDYRLNGYNHPVFSEMWAAFPLLFLKPLIPVFHPAWVEQKWDPVSEYTFADRWLHQNRVPAEKLMEAGRRMQQALSILFGIIITAAGWMLGGALCALLSMGFWAFSTAVLAHGTLVSTDLAFTAFFFLFFFALHYRNSRTGVITAGVALGLCAASKYFFLTVFPCLIAVIGWNLIRKKEPFFPEREGRRAAIIAVVAVFVVALIYRFSELDVFVGGIKHALSLSQAGRSSFFWGRHGTDGWLGYFPLAFLVKTEIAMLAALAISLYVIWRRKISLPALFWIPPLVYLGLACFSKVQIGHRHILVIYPFLFVIASLGLSQMKSRAKPLAFVLVAGLALETWLINPHFLSFFNRLAGGPENGYKYLTDSNVDWGQGMKLLRQALNEADLKNGIYLSYFGTADPHAYGIRYLDIGSDSITRRKDDSAASGMSPTVFAISVTHLQATYYADKTAFSWLAQYKPSKIVAHSIFIYDFSNSPEAIERLKQLRAGPA